MGAPGLADPVPASAATGAPATPPANTGSSPAAAGEKAPAEAPRIIALILPAKGSPFGRAAEVARQGFLAARQVAGGGMEVRVFETDGSADSAAEAFGRALEARARVVVGPLTRAEVGGVLRLPLKVPTLALNTPEGEARLPPNFYALSLNTETEARAAAVASYRADAATAVIVATGAALSKRAAAAFADAWTRLGGNVRETVEYAGSLGRVRQAVERARGDIVFLATDAERARLLRPYLGRNTPVIGTSQVFGGASRTETGRAFDLNGVRFVDMPWLHQPDHAAAMVFPRPETALSADLERLYALGIDAFRIAQELARERTGFEIDGVTGNLTVHEGVIERKPLVVEFRDGAPAPLR